MSEVPMNKQKRVFRQLDACIRKLKRMLREGSELGNDEFVRSALRELDRAQSGGRIESERIVKAID